MACNGDCTSCANKIREGNAAIYEKKAIPGFCYENLMKPTAAVVNVTDSCNNCCPYCFTCDKENNMSLATAEKTIRFLQQNCKDNERPTITFFGGEPLLRFDDLIRPLVEKYQNSVIWSITTNGTLMTEEIISFLAENSVRVLLSFDGVKNVQDSQRPMKNGESSYEKVMENIDFLLMKIPTVTVRATITKESLPYMFESMLFFERIGFKHCYFCLNEREDYDMNDFKIMQEQLFKCAEYIYCELIKGRFPIRNDSIIHYFNEVIEVHDNPVFNNQINRCGMGTTAIGVAYNGDLLPCQEENTTLSRVIGNIESGIDAEKHMKYLIDYFNIMENLDCQKDCSNSNRLFCYNQNCPNILIENQGKINNSHCLFYQAAFLVARRLETLCRHSINPNVSQYFGGMV